MSEFIHVNIENIPQSHKNEQEEYEYFRKKVVPFGTSRNALVSVYEIPPGKSAYPYHYHHNNEETFFILSGEGILRTPDGEKIVKSGDCLFFPSGPKGAHKLTNASATENLVYIDFDVVHEIDITAYPDSDKLGIWGMGINKLFRKEDAFDYYDGE